MFTEEKYDFFNAYLCHVCKSKESFAQAKLCSSCKLIAYCGEEHQKADRENHKMFCNTVKKICEDLGEEDVFDVELDVAASSKHTNNRTSERRLSKSEWHNIRVRVALLIRGILTRLPDPYEMKMIILPRHCAHCFKRNIKKDLVCKNCFGAAYCSAEHRSLDEHDKICSDLQRVLNIDLFMLNLNFDPREIPLIKPNQGDNLKLDACDMKSFIAKYIKEGLKFEVEVLVSFFYTSVLTFSYSINRIPNFTLGKRLTIHIIGATGPCEGFVLEFWENLLHLFPRVHAVNLVHIGPAIAGPPCKLKLCDTCTSAEKSIDILVYKQMYHEYYRSPHFMEPHVIIAFNSGLFGDPEQLLRKLPDSWEPTLPLLFQHHNVPVILTEKSKNEAERDLERLLSRDEIRGKNVRVVVNCEKNPFPNLRPWNIWTEKNHAFPTKNSYVSALVVESG